MPGGLADVPRPAPPDCSAAWHVSDQQQVSALSGSSSWQALCFVSRPKGWAPPASLEVPVRRCNRRLLAGTPRRAPFWRSRGCRSSGTRLSTLAGCPCRVIENHLETCQGKLRIPDVANRGARLGGSGTWVTAAPQGRAGLLGSHGTGALNEVIFSPNVISSLQNFRIHSLGENQFKFTAWKASLRHRFRLQEAR